MARPLPLVAALVLAAVLLPASARGAVRLEPVATDLTDPVHVASRPGDDSRLFIVQRDGTIRVVEDGVLRDEPFMDPPATLKPGWEEGLLSIAFEPAPSRAFYIVFTEQADAPDPVTGNDVVVQRRQLLAADDGTADPDPGTIDEVLRIHHHEGVFHHGGLLQLNRDGTLFLSSGDGMNRPAVDDPTSLLGKILRIKPKPTGDGYDVPDGNPYANAVWSSGLRNPWRFSFDRATGDLYIGDVGETQREEVNRAPAPDLGKGATYGWPRFEGDLDADPSEPAPAGYAAPFIVHPHPEFRAVTGGYVSRDPSIPELFGCYVYTDFLETQLHVADPGTGAHSRLPDITTAGGVVSFGEDNAGRLYVVSLFGNRVDRIVQHGAPGTTGSRCAPPGRPPDQPAPPPSTPATPPPAGGDPPATRPPGPRTSLRIAPRQRTALTRRAITLRVTCIDACRLALSGRVVAAGRTLGLQPVRRSLPARRRATLKVKLGPKAVAAARRSRRPRARLTLRFTDVAGNVTRRGATVALK